jgi:hypothetical protein
MLTSYDKRCIVSIDKATALLKEVTDMKKLFRTCDTETVFYDDEVAKARTYYDAPDECETLEEIADWWNSENGGKAIGTMIVKEV